MNFSSEQSINMLRETETRTSADEFRRKRVIYDVTFYGEKRRSGRWLHHTN